MCLETFSTWITSGCCALPKHPKVPLWRPEILSSSILYLRHITQDPGQLGIRIFPKDIPRQEALRRGGSTELDLRFAEMGKLLTQCIIQQLRFLFVIPFYYCTMFDPLADGHHVHIGCGYDGYIAYRIVGLLSIQQEFEEEKRMRTWCLPFGP